MPSRVFSEGGENPRECAYVSYYPTGVVGEDRTPTIFIGGWHQGIEPIGPKRLTLAQFLQTLGITPEDAVRAWEEAPLCEGVIITDPRNLRAAGHERPGPNFSTSKISEEKIMAESEPQIRRADERDGWATFTRRTDEPKLTWLEQQLAHVGIESRRNGRSFHAPILEVRADRLLDAWAILERPVGQLFVTDDTTITVDDLADDHPLFQEAFTGQGGTADAPFLVGGVGPRPALAANPTQFPDGKGGPGVHVVMYDVDSSNLSALGVTPFYEAGDPVGEGAPEPENVVIYVQFKGASYYRYFPFPAKTWLNLREEALLVAGGNQEASVGSLFHALVKVHTEKGSDSLGQTVFCEKLENGGWVTVPPKSQRPKRGGK